MSVTDTAGNRIEQEDPDAPAPGTNAAAERSYNPLLVFFEKYALVVLFAAVFLFFSVYSSTHHLFLSLGNVRDVLGAQAVGGILALAAIIPLVCGQFDFTVGAIAGLSQIATAAAMSRFGAPLPVAILVGVLIGVLVGASNGNTVARIGVNSLITTLGVSQLIQGIINWYTKGNSIVTGISPKLISFGTNNWLGIPRVTYALAVIALLVYYLLQHTPYGRYLHSVGSNPQAARLVGLKVENLTLIAFTLSGLLAGIAGVLVVARNGSAGPTTIDPTYTLQALAAAFLGATAIKPGRFNVLGTVIAIFFLAFSVNGLQYIASGNAQSWVPDVFSGAALTLAVIISTVIGRKRAGVA